MSEEQEMLENGKPRQGSACQTFALSFMHDLALDKKRVLSEHERIAVNTANKELKQANIVIVRIGGKAGRLGECVVGTALLEGVLHALHYCEKAGTPVYVVVDEAAIELFNEKLYQKKYWPQITIKSIAPAQTQEIPQTLMTQIAEENVLVFDLHGAHDGMPYLQIKERQSDDLNNNYRIATLAHLFRVGVRSYAHRGSERRYANFIEDLFALPGGAINDRQIQPTILLMEEDEERYALLARELGLDEQAFQVICFFQSVVIAKCYCRWNEVMTIFSKHFAQNFPGQKINFLIACGPDDIHPEGLKKADFVEEFGDFSGMNDNARVIVHSVSSLRDLAILTKHALLAFANDTGPGHIAGALQVPTVTPYLPGNVYSKKVWSSTLWHRGVTLEPNPFSYQQIEAAVLWDHTAIIDSIPPVHLVNEALQSLPPEFQAAS